MKKRYSINETIFLEVNVNSHPTEDLTNQYSFCLVDSAHENVLLRADNFDASTRRWPFHIHKPGTTNRLYFLGNNIKELKEKFITCATAIIGEEYGPKLHSILVMF